MTNPKSTLLSALGAILLLTSSLTAANAAMLDITLKPEVENGMVDAVVVKTRYDLAGAPLSPLVLPETLGPLFHIADRIEAVSAHDASGPLQLVTSSGERKNDDATPLGGKIRVWTPSRPTHGPVVVEYRARVSREMLPGPSWELRAEPRGVSGAGNTFLLLPNDERAYAVKLNWDLSQLPAEAKAIASLPQSTDAVPVSAISESYFMAGRLFTTPQDGGPFRAASTADTPYDQNRLLEWTAEAYRKMHGLFGEPMQPAFTVLFRGSKISSISGTELRGALMATMKADTPIAEVEQLAAHEMVHVFMNGLDPESWFEEGLAVTYQHRAPFMTGQIDADAYIEDVNSVARTYYSNVRYDMPMKEAEESFWTDARARLQPYMRGSMYFNLIDAKLRAKTGGKRGLDAVVHEFIAMRNAGKPVAVADWVALLSHDLGTEAQNDYEEMMSGKRIILPSNAFGPCFARKAEKMPQFELGFNIGSLMQQPRIIKDLDPNSPAAQAGLHEGDKVVSATPLDAAQETPEMPMSIKVERSGKTVEIKFSPKGKITDGYQWIRVNDVPEKSCRI
jgi:hypothetical protein